MYVKFKKLHPDAVIPQYATKGSAGFDLVALENTFVAKGEIKLVRTGLACALHPDFEMQIRPRSGMSVKCGSYIPNAPGTIDADYRGEIKVPVKGDIGSIMIWKGNRIAQGVVKFVPGIDIEQVDELPETARGSGGFGSTG